MNKFLLITLAQLLLLAALPTDSQAQDAEFLSLTVGNRWIYDFRKGNTDIFAEEKQPTFAHTRKRNTCVIEIVGDTIIGAQDAAIVRLIDVPRSDGYPFIGDTIYWANRDSVFMQYGTYACHELEFSATWLWYDNLMDNPSVTQSTDIPYCLGHVEPHHRSIDAGQSSRTILGDPTEVQSWGHWMVGPDGGTSDNLVFAPKLGLIEFGARFRWRNNAPHGFLATLRGAVIDGQVIGDTSLATDAIAPMEVDSAGLACLLQTGNRWVYNYSMGRVSEGHRISRPNVSSPTSEAMMSLEVVGDTVFSVYVRDTLVGSIDAAIVEARNLPAQAGNMLENRTIYWSLQGSNLVELQDFCSQTTPSYAYLWHDSLARTGNTGSIRSQQMCAIGDSRFGFQSQPFTLTPVDLFGDTLVSQAWNRSTLINSIPEVETESYAFSPQLGPLIHLTKQLSVDRDGFRSYRGSYAQLVGAVVCGKVYGDTTITSVGANKVRERDFAISVRPTPFQNTLQLTLQGVVTQPVTIKLYDVQGRVVFSEQRRASGFDMQFLNLELGMLDDGIYLVSVEADGVVSARTTVIKAP